jgi:hypothetical protein
MDRVETVVRGDELVLSAHGPQFGSSVEYEVTVPSLRALRISGSGDIVSADTLTGPALDIAIMGSGSVEAALDVDSLSVNSSGSGDMKLSGNADKTEIKIHGSGDLDASDLDGVSADISVIGSGDAELGEFQELNANVIGSGDVEYDGNPRVTAHTPGSGDVSRR